MTGQFGKNHLGDRDEMLPTAHGFDEFFGNLYHLNAEEEPENPDYSKNPALKKKFGPRGVIHSFADGRITDTGPLTKKRMETIDEEVTAKALDFMERADEGRQAVLPLVELHPHAHLHAPEGGVRGQDRPRHLRRRHGRARRPRRPGAREAQGTGPRREHDRHVLDRQRRRDLHLARRRHDDVPRREEHAVGGRLPRADDDQVAGRHQAGHGHQRHRRARGHADHAPRRGGRHDRQGRPAEGPQDRRHDLQGPPRRLRPRPGAAGARRRGRATSSSTGPTTAASRRCATTTGRSRSWSRRPRA